MKLMLTIAGGVIIAIVDLTAGRAASSTASVEQLGATIHRQSRLLAGKTRGG